MDSVLSPAQVKKRILDIARRLPDVALAMLATFEKLGNHHPVIDQIVTLIDQRCALTIRRLTQTTITHPLWRQSMLVVRPLSIRKDVIQRVQILRVRVQPGIDVFSLQRDDAAVMPSG